MPTYLCPTPNPTVLELHQLDEDQVNFTHGDFQERVGENWVSPRTTEILKMIYGSQKAES